MSFKVRLVGAHAHETTPKLALYEVGANGQIGRKIAAAADGKLELPGRRKGSVAFGPDAHDPATIDPRAFVTVRLSDHVPAWEKSGEILIPGPWWRGWLGFETCLSGTATRCTPWLLERDALRASALGRQSIIVPERCAPLCTGIVEVWESVTCCWPLPIYEVPTLIAKIETFLETNPIMFPVPPRPDPGPVEATLASRVDRAFAAGAVDPRFVPNSDLAQHLQTLRALPLSEAVAYVDLHPILWYFWCNSSTAQLGEAPLNPDGSFSFCYYHYPFLLLNCRTSYFYRIRQYINGIWTLVYDGQAAHQYFTADQAANLFTQTGVTCVRQPPVPADSITLAAIGATYAWDLNSHWNSADGAGNDLTQTGDFTLPIPASQPDAGLYSSDGAPWTGTLWLSLNFDEGLKAQGAVYYRFSTVQADLSGNPIGTPQPIVNSINWMWQDNTISPPPTNLTLLGPNSAGLANSNLYTIPYYSDHDWLGVYGGPAGAFHQWLDTTTLINAVAGAAGNGNGRYMLVLEVFDAAGNRLVPAASVSAPQPGDVAANFSFVRLLGAPVGSTPGPSSVVPYAALSHMVWVDNRPVNGKIGYFQSSAGTQECQFIQADTDTIFQTGYYAYHTVMCDNPAYAPIPSRSFMASYTLTWQEGLGGSSGTLAAGTDTNAPAVCPAGASYAVSPPTTTFGTMLAGQTACAFAITLGVTGKHTNGFGSVGTLYWPAAVALSV